jgi:hypothetical protein
MKNVVELSFTSTKTYLDPYNEIELDVVFTGPQGQTRRVPAFWAGGQIWRVRYAPDSAGVHEYRLICTDSSNPELHGKTGAFAVDAPQASDGLCAHGPLCVAQNGRYLEFADGTPFFWLGDTWWLGLCQRRGWGFEEFKTLVEDRVAKGFSVIQIVAGLCPDLPPFDPRGFNEGGYPWEADFARINPAYFDWADRRIEYLVESGLVPCIFGSWGYFLPFMGVARMKQHWRNLVARWSALPVVWCLAGEADMPYYLSQDPRADRAAQRQGFAEVGRYLRAIDPYHRPVTIHPMRAGRDAVSDDTVLDFDPLQTGHGDLRSAPNTVETVCQEYRRQPAMPVIDGEVCYEGHMQMSGPLIQRFMFWTCMLYGAAGHTYGAGGIWQMNTREQPHGPSPHGGTYENTPWDVAAQLPGARQLALGKALLMRYPWWRLEPHPEWVEPHWGVDPFEGTEAHWADDLLGTQPDPDSVYFFARFKLDKYLPPHAAAVPGGVRLIYIPARVYMWSGPLVKELEEGVRYRAFYFDPINGDEYDLGTLVTGAGRTWQAPNVPLAQDWVLVLEPLL